MGKRPRQNPGKDFAKKKRKVGKAKAVPDNATNTAFVSRGISVPTQLAVKGEHVPTTKRKLSFTELLSQLNHHNGNFRHDALLGLRELFTSHPVILSTNLSVLLEKISPIFTDSGSAVRQALLLLLKHIIENVTKSSLASFFPRLVACMMCAMTHIDKSIQLDSLKFLQLFLTDCSDLLIKNAPKLPNLYLSLLTCQVNVIDVTKGDNAVSTSSIEKLVPMKTRLKIFAQLSELLKTSMDLTAMDNDDHGSNVTTQVVPCFDVVNGKEISGLLTGHCLNFFNLSRSVPNIKLVSNWGIHPPANAFLKDCSMKKMDDERYLFSSFTAKLVPILFECWMESRPIRLLSGSSNSVELDMKLAVMKLLLYIVRLAHIYSGESGMSEMRGLYSNQFQKCFLTYFPFNNLSKSDYLFMLNLYLCEITILLFSGVNKLSKNHATLMLNFFSQTLPIEFQLFVDNPNVISECSLCFTRCLRNIILCSDEILSLAAMLKGGVDFYNNCHMRSQAKQYLMKTFYKILLVKEDMWKRCESASLVSWLSGLPQLLKKLGSTNLETSSLILDVISHAASKNILSMVDCLVEQLFNETSFIGMLPKELQRKAVTLVWHLPLLDGKSLKLISKLILEPEDTLKLDVANFLIQIVNERLLREYRSADSDDCALDTDDKSLYIVALYLSFFWNIITLGSITSGDIDNIDTSNYIAKDEIPSGFADKIKYMCKCILASDFSDQVWDLVSHKMECLLSCKCIPLSTVLGVLWFTIGINKTQPLMESSSCFYSIATLILQLLTYIYNEETDDTSVPHGLILNLLLNVENLLPALLHNIMSVLNTGGGTILIKLLKEPKLAHLFYKHRGILPSIISSCNKDFSLTPADSNENMELREVVNVDDDSMTENSNNSSNNSSPMVHKPWTRAEKRMLVAEAMQSGISVTARRHNMSWSTLRGWMMKDFRDLLGTKMSLRGKRPLMYQSIDTTLKDWVLRKMAMKNRVSCEELSEKAMELILPYNPGFQVSQKWITKFLHRHELLG